MTTALADVLAGYAAAGLGQGRALAWLLVSTACLYAGGVVLNDFFDRKVDAIERPERPIPSGRVRPASAARFGVSLSVAGVIAASMANRTAGLMALTIAGLTLLYDAWGKRSDWFGPINMGACRGLNLLLGMAAVPVAIAGRWPLAILPFAYIAAVTALSRGEVHGGTRAIAAGSLIAVALVMIALGLLGLLTPGAEPLAAAMGLLLTLVLAWRVLPAFWRAVQDPGPGAIRSAIRAGVLSLILLDAVIGAVYAGAVYGGLIVGTAVVAGWLARPFAVT